MTATKTPTVEVNGYALREWRKREGVSAQELVTRVKALHPKGIARSRIAQIESMGTTHNRLSRDAFEAVAAALDLTDHRALLVNPYGGAAA